MKDGPVSITPEEANAKYTQAWSEPDVDKRLELLEGSWADDGVFVDPEVPGGLVGRQALSDYITRSYEEMPGLKITLTSDPETLGGRLRARWVAVADSSETYTGTDFVEFSADGRISQLTMFYNSTPG